MIEFLENQDLVNEFFQDIASFFERWLPRFDAEGRSYLTVAIGCTGGQHRSVYLADTLCRHFKKTAFNVIVRHRELS